MIQTQTAGLFASPITPKKILAALLLGGLPVILFTYFYVFQNTPDQNFSGTEIMLALFINFPHFVSSYALLYSDFRSNILSQLRYFFVAFIVPAALIYFFYYTLANNRDDYFSAAVNIFKTFAVYHVVKQSFGIVMALSAQEKVFFSKFERNVLLFNFYALCVFEFFHTNTSNLVERLAPIDQFRGVEAYYFNFNPVWFYISIAVFTVSTCYLFYVNYKKYLREKIKPSFVAFVVLLSTYFTFVPFGDSNKFLFLLVIFHPLQYLVFVYFFKKNKLWDDLKVSERPQMAKLAIAKLVTYFVIVLAASTFFLKYLPSILFSKFGYDQGKLYAVFFLFISIHHYFIDQVIWGRDNPVIHKYVFSSGWFK